MEEDFPKDCADCPVWKQSLFVDLEPGLIAWITDRKKAYVFGNRDVVFRQGQEVDGIYCHLRGLVKVVQTDERGKTRFSRLVLPGDTSGHRSLFIENTYKGTAEVVSETLHACYIPKDDILHLLSNNTFFARNLLVKITRELGRAEEARKAVEKQPVRARLARLLWDLSVEYSEDIDGQRVAIKSVITKREIAGILSVAHETVIRLMSEMKAEGVIGYEGRKIIVNDRKKMQEIAGG